MKLRTAQIAAISLLTAAFGSMSAFAQPRFPDRPIRIVVPYPPGGAADIIARSVGDKMARELGQAVVVDNRPGANGTVGAEFVAKSIPDGYTVLANGVGAMLIIPQISKVGYDPMTDFTPLTQAANLTLAWVARSDFKIRNMADLIATGKTSQQFSVATNGNGGPYHLAVEQFNQMTGTRLTPIPYRGEQQAVTDLLGGQVDMVLTSVLPAAGFIRDGRLQALATTGQQRSKFLPQVPTVSEAGVTGYEMIAWQGFFVPAKTPKAIVERLQKSMVHALRSEEVAERLRLLGGEVVASSSEEFAAQMREEYIRYGKLAKSINLQMK